MKNKNILITGIDGFIGKSLKEALKRDNKIIGIVNKKKLNKIKSNLISLNTNNLKKIPFMPDYIFHCAGTSSVSKSFIKSKEDYEKNYLTTKILIEFYKQTPIKPTIFIFSSAAVYGNNKKLLNPISNYGKNKLLAEKLSINYANKFDMKIIILRIFSVYGEKNCKQLFWDICKKISSKKNIFFGTGKEIRSWIHISDLLSAINLIKDVKKFPFIIDVGSYKPTINKNIIKLFYKAFDFNFVPKFNNVNRKGDPKEQISNNTKLKDLGWKQKIKITKGIMLYARWFKKKN
tara:strand:+ start:183 stop:1052 length:870 start_codon:yes stop_codon:yes gene_type:complete